MRCVCVCVCVWYVCLKVCAYIWMLVFMVLYMYVFICICMYVHMCLNTHTHTHIYMCVCVCVNVWRRRAKVNMSSIFIRIWKLYETNRSFFFSDILRKFYSFICSYIYWSTAKTTSYLFWPHSMFKENSLMSTILLLWGKPLISKLNYQTSLVEINLIDYFFLVYSSMTWDKDFKVLFGGYLF